MYAQEDIGAVLRHAVRWSPLKGSCWRAVPRAGAGGLWGGNARLLGTLMVALAITGPAWADVEITDAIGREFTVYNDLAAPIAVTDTVSREFTAFNDLQPPVELADAIAREFAVFNDLELPIGIEDAVSREFTAYNDLLEPIEPDAVSREFTVFKPGAVSRKTHGSAGTFDVTVHVPGAIEPRQAGPTRVIVTFDQEVQAPGGLDTGDVWLSSGAVTGVALYTDNGPQLTIDLTGATNQANMLVGYPGLVDDQGDPLAETLCFGVLAGDATGDRRVNVLDLVQVRNVLNQGPTQSTFTRDVTADGAVNVLDLVAIRNVLNTALPDVCP